MKTPLEFVVSAVRATGATVVNAQPLVAAAPERSACRSTAAQPPTGYSMTADAWVNTGSLLSRMNFALQLVTAARCRRARTRSARPGRAASAAAAISLDSRATSRPGRLRPRADSDRPGDPRAGHERAVADECSIDTMLAGRASDATQKTLARAETPQQLVALTLGSPEFQRR